ncbi:MAG: family 20 glycosylhydrolase [Clostridia bacterium]|nr:family 20 glycosylhydrolase [Clostridia bacterium]
MKNFFKFGNKVTVTAPESFDNALMKELWQGFCYSASEAVFLTTDKNEIIIGDPEPQKNTDACVLSVSKSGIRIDANDNARLTDGYLALLQKIKPVCLESGKEELCVPVGEYEIIRPIQRKMVHFCVFPETDLFFMKRFIRLAGFLRYTHIILEFWGTYRFECLPELAWRERSYTKEQLRPLIDEAHAFGMEVIPDFNHLGHASSCRHIYGKHTVLDQNPRLATLFSDDGWAWNLENPKVRPLLKQIRKELCELCGDSEYFHLGCDECYTYEGDPEKMALAAAYHSDVCNEVIAEGRRPIIWGDMFLCKDTIGYSKVEPYECNCKSEDIAETLFEKLPKETVIADWQYNVKEGVWRSTEYFMKKGFDTVCCPWETKANIKSALDTVKALNAYGFMETTWHHLPKMIDALYYINAKSENRTEISVDAVYKTETAALLRKLLPARTYEEAGWARTQLEFI